MPNLAAPGDLPPPSADFGKTALSLVVPAKKRFRIHHQSYDAVFFSKAQRSRWDRNGPYGTMCLGETLAGIVLERFGDHFLAHGRFLTKTEITEFRVTAIELEDPPQVFDIRENQLFHAGVDARLISGRYRVSRAYSRAFMEHPAGAHGLLYNSRHNTALTNLVLFDRDPSIAWIHKRQSWLLKNHPDFKAVLAELRIAIAP